MFDIKLTKGKTYNIPFYMVIGEVGEGFDFTIRSDGYLVRKINKYIEGYKRKGIFSVKRIVKEDLRISNLFKKREVLEVVVVCEYDKEW